MRYPVKTNFKIKMPTIRFKNKDNADLGVGEGGK